MRGLGVPVFGSVVRVGDAEMRQSGGLSGRRGRDELSRYVEPLSGVPLSAVPLYLLIHYLLFRYLCCSVSHDPLLVVIWNISCSVISGDPLHVVIWYISCSVISAVPLYLVFRYVWWSGMCDPLYMIFHYMRSVKLFPPRNWSPRAFMSLLRA